MKAAVLHKFGEAPRYEDFPDPVPEKGDALVRVKAVALENFDRVTANGTHYSSRQLFPIFPAIVGHSGVGILDDGTMAAFGGSKPPYGTMAEKAVVPQMYRMYMTPIPDGVELAIAAALPSSSLTSLLALKWGAKMQVGETVLINGATGVSGKLGVQIAKLLGAGRVVGTGRQAEALKSLEGLGADAVIDLKQSDEKVAEAFIKEAGKGYNIVLDFLWGPPTEILLKTLVPKEAGFPQRRIRLMQIGESAGPTISLSGEEVRTSGLEISGAGNIPFEALPEATKQIWDWMKDNKLRIDIERVPLKDVEQAWLRKDVSGKRLVIIPP